MGNSRVTMKRHPRPAAAQRRACVRAGFSLIELVMVVVILAVVGAMAAPRFLSSRDAYRVQSATDRLQQDIEAAREQAMASSAPCIITFAVGTGQYSVAGMDGSRASARSVDLNSSPFLARIQSASPTSLRIDAFGVPDADINLALRSNGRQCELKLVRPWQFVRGRPHRPATQSESSGGESD